MTCNTDDTGSTRKAETAQTMRHMLPSNYDLDLLPHLPQHGVF